jgi:hypothetical protein
VEIGFAYTWMPGDIYSGVLRTLVLLIYLYHIAAGLKPREEAIRFCKVVPFQNEGWFVPANGLERERELL